MIWLISGIRRRMKASAYEKRQLARGKAIVGDLNSQGRTPDNPPERSNGASLSETRPVPSMPEIPPWCDQHGKLLEDCDHG